MFDTIFCPALSLSALIFMKVDDIVGEHATLVKDHYYVKPSGNCDLSRRSDPHNEFKGKNVLIERSSTSAMASKHALPVEQYLDILGNARQRLFDVRSERPRPHLDDKVYFFFADVFTILIMFSAITDLFL